MCKLSENFHARFHAQCLRRWFLQQSKVQTLLSFLFFACKFLKKNKQSQTLIKLSNQCPDFELSNITYTFAIQTSKNTEKKCYENSGNSHTKQESKAVNFWFSKLKFIFQQVFKHISNVFKIRCTNVSQVWKKTQASKKLKFEQIREPICPRYYTNREFHVFASADCIQSSQIENQLCKFPGEPSLSI